MSLSIATTTTIYLQKLSINFIPITIYHYHILFFNIIKNIIRLLYNLFYIKNLFIKYVNTKSITTTTTIIKIITSSYNQRPKEILLFYFLIDFI